MPWSNECRRKAEHNRADTRCETPDDDIGNTEVKTICYDFSNARETLGFNEAKAINLFFLQLLLGETYEKGINCSISILNKILTE